MLIPESQASDHRCCGPEGCGEVDSIDSRRYCVGTNCMAWRWGTEPQHQDTCAAVKSARFLNKEDCDCEMSPPLGYCGLAKMPEGI